MRSRREYTERELQFLRDESAKGTSDEDIATILDRSVGSVSNARRWRKIPKPDKRWTKEEEEIMIKLFNEGLTAREIANYLYENDIRKTTSGFSVRNHLAKLGYRRYGNGKS